MISYADNVAIFDAIRASYVLIAEVVVLVVLIFIHLRLDWGNWRVGWISSVSS
jgi:hypothetical protein